MPSHNMNSETVLRSKLSLQCFFGHFVNSGKGVEAVRLRS